jgi:hypothetical protein
MSCSAEKWLLRPVVLQPNLSEGKRERNFGVRRLQIQRSAFFLSCATTSEVFSLTAAAAAVVFAGPAAVLSSIDDEQEL